MKLKQSGKHNVVFSAGDLEVEVTDAFTADRKSEHRLPGSTLLTVIENILGKTSSTWEMTGSTQEWPRKGDGEAEIDICEFEDDPKRISFSLLDDDLSDRYNVDLVLVRGTSDDLVEICSYS